jgi:uncharacterized membrane protein YeiH
MRLDDEARNFCNALIVGVMNGIKAGVPCAAAIACGVFTATFGGVVRDVLLQRPVRILHSYTDIYATTALSGATVRRRKLDPFGSRFRSAWSKLFLLFIFIIIDRAPRHFTW